LGAEWNGYLSLRPDDRGIRVGWLSPGQLTDPADVAPYPRGVPATTVDDQWTMITAAKRGALAVTYTRSDGLTVHTLTAHLKSKLLTFPGHDPQHPRFDTHDEGERARFGLYALTAGRRSRHGAGLGNRPAARPRPATPRACLRRPQRYPQAATTQLLLGPPGSELGTGGFDRPDAGDGNRLWDLAPRMPAGDPVTGEGAANWPRINNGVKELIDQILVSQLLVHALDSTESLPMDGIKSATADPASLADMKAPSDHRPVIARFNL